jgi:hypothetical protein
MRLTSLCPRILTGIPHFFCLFIFWLIQSQPGFSQSRFAVTPEVAQLIHDGQQAMYNCDYQSADQKFDALVRLYPDHPAGYMYKAACLWWKCLEDRNNKELQTRFLQYAEDGIARGEVLVKRDPNDFYAQMFLAGVYGNQTQFYVTITHSYLSAMRSGTKGDRHNRIALALRPECIDCLIGTGSYYYAPEALPSILRRLVMVMGVNGNLSRSIRDLQTAADKGEFAQTEAKIVLLGIYYNEKWFDKYRILLLSLINQYPSNPLFYRWLTDFYIQQRQCEEGIRFFSGLLTETSRNPKFQVSRKYAFLAKGRLELERKALDEALSSFTRGIEIAGGDRAFLAQVHLLRGFALDLLGQRDPAIREYQTVLALPNVDETHKIASHFSKVPYQGRL